MSDQDNKTPADTGTASEVAQKVKERREAELLRRERIAQERTGSTQGPA